MDKEQDIVICLSGRGDKDVQSVADELPKLGPAIGWDLRCEFFCYLCRFGSRICGVSNGMR